MEIERGKVRTREEIMACFKDGQTIAIGGRRLHALGSS